MANLIESDGKLTVQSDTCATSSGLMSRPLHLGRSSDCSEKKYVEAVTSSQDVISTASGVFEDVDAAEQISEIQFLYVRSSTEVILRLYALPASALASAGAFPTGFVGGETLLATIDGVLTTVTFDVADQTAAQVAARINAALALAGYATPLASVVNGQIKVLGVATKRSGNEGTLSFAGTGASQLGLDAGSNPTIVEAQGQDVAINGLFMSEFPSSGDNTLTKIQISGSATVDIITAGRA